MRIFQNTLVITINATMPCMNHNMLGKFNTTKQFTLAHLSRYDSTDARSVKRISAPPLPDAHLESSKQFIALDPVYNNKHTHKSATEINGPTKHTLQ